MDGKTIKELFTLAETQKDIDIVYLLAMQLKKNPYIIAGLKKAGFKGGWLDSVSYK